MEHVRALDAKVLLKGSDACPTHNPVTGVYACALRANLNYAADRLESRSKRKVWLNLVTTLNYQQVREINSRRVYSNQRGGVVRNGLRYLHEFQVLPKRTKLFNYPSSQLPSLQILSTTTSSIGIW